MTIKSMTEYETINYKTFLDIFSPLPEIGEILEESESVEEAREKLFEFCKELEWEIRMGRMKFKNEVDRWLSLKAIEVFLNIISKDNERLAGFSTLKYLWKAYKGDEEALKEIGEGFIEEFKHLFLAMSGKADYSLGFLGLIVSIKKSKSSTMLLVNPQATCSFCPITGIGIPAIHTPETLNLPPFK